MIIGSFSVFGILAVSNELKDNEIVHGTGKIVFLSFEGGFYGIISDDDKHYDPINLLPEYKIDGLQVEFKAKICKNQVSIHMWGILVEILFIRNLMM